MMTSIPEDTNPSGAAGNGQQGILSYCVLCILLLAGLAVGIFGAWSFKHAQNSDYGIVAIMAKHMAEGHDFPVFFYGQPYMGSLEPAISAILCKLLGFSGFAICLGTSLVGFLLLPVVYFWGKDAAGHAAGLAALAFCAIGPSSLFQYQNSPRGGYAVVLLFGTIILWMAANMVFQMLKREKVRYANYFVLGLVAGLGWWSDQLITAAILAAGFLFLVTLKRRAFGWHILPAVLGFFVGSLPLWIWNLYHNWETFTFLKSLGRYNFRVGLSYFIWERFPAIFDLHRLPPVWKFTALFFYAAACITAFSVFAVRVKREGLTRRNIHLMSVLLFFVFSIVLFSASRYSRLDTTRYLLPLVPAMAVILGITSAHLARLLPYGLAYVPLTCLIAWQACQLPDFQALSKEYEGWFGETRKLGTFLRNNDIKAIYIGYADHSLNYALNEEFCFSDLKDEHYPPYADFAESADSVAILSVAVLNDYDYVSSFIEAAGGSVRHGGPDSMYVYYDFHPPVTGWREVSPSSMALATDYLGKEVLKTITDRNADTVWQSGAEKKKSLDIVFKEPMTVSGVRIFSAKLCYPEVWQIQGKSTAKDSWRNLSGRLLVTDYFWSGPRIYFGGNFFRLECRFGPVTLTNLRILLSSWKKTAPEVTISEVQIFGPDENTLEPEETAFPRLKSLLEQRKITRLYCDRWVANAVRRLPGKKISTPCEMAIFRRQKAETSNSVNLDAGTALLVRNEDAVACRQALSESHIKMRETTLGPWILFDFAPEQWHELYAGKKYLYWAGFTCFLCNDKCHAADLVRQASLIYSQAGPTPEAVDLLEAATRLYPNFPGEIKTLAAWYRESGQSEKAEELEQRIASMWVPKTPAEARFNNGVVLLGVGLEPCRAKPGDRLRICYYWRCPPETKNELVAVFVHFTRDGKRPLFQDDHVLLKDKDTSFQPFPDEIFVEERTVSIPENLQRGEYGILLGLYDRRPPGKRLRVQTDLPERKRAVSLPLVIHII